MASKEEHYVPGSMDISQHQRGYAGFLTFVKYSLGFILLVMVFLAVFAGHVEPSAVDSDADLGHCRP